jgi:hypothetical protein
VFGVPPDGILHGARAIGDAGRERGGSVSGLLYWRVPLGANRGLFELRIYGATGDDRDGLLALVDMIRVHLPDLLPSASERADPKGDSE